MGCFFPDSRTEFDKLANNIGWARLWGGVHWERDHTFGQQVGAAVGRLIIAQLDATGIGAMSEAPVERPSPDSVRDDARDFHQECESAKSDFCKGVWKADAPAQIQNTI